MADADSIDLQLWVSSSRVATKYRFSGGTDVNAALAWMDKNRSAGLLDLVETDHGSFIKVRTRWVPIPAKLVPSLRKATAAERIRMLSREKLVG